MTNNAGVISSKDSLTLNHSALLTNQKGLINSQKDLNIQGVDVDNSQGEISSTGNLSLDTQMQKLNNQQGVIGNASGTLSLSTGEINNDAGLIQSAGDLSLDTHHQNLINTNTNVNAAKGIIVQGNTNISSANLDNTSGRIQGNGDLTTSIDQDIKNAQGSITAQNLTLNAQNSIDNGLGLISGKNIQLNTNTLNNTGDAGQTALGSVISADENLNINAQNIQNQNTRAPNSAQGLQAKSVQITTKDLNNTSGSIRSNSLTDIAATGTVTNDKGLISSNTQVNIHDDQATRTINLTNDQGTIVADQALNFKLKNLDSIGKITTNGNLSVDLQSDYVQQNQDQLVAGGSLDLITTGKVTNQSELTAGGTLSVQAQSFENQANAKVAGGTATNITVQGNIDNHGLINGGDTTLKANTVNNLGTGRIYGDHIAVQADTLNNTPENGTAAVIASRGDMDLGVRVLNNNENIASPDSQSLIYSGNDLRIGGALDNQGLATGSSEVINNRSAKIEANRNLDLLAQKVNNLNVLYKTDEKLISSQDRTSYQLPDNPKIYDISETTPRRKGSIFVIELNQEHESFWRYLYKESIYQDYLVSSNPAQMIAGNNINFKGSIVDNQGSQIIAGNTIAGDTKVDNTTIEGLETSKVENGVSQWHYLSNGGRYTPAVPYTPTDVKKGIDLLAGTKLEHQSVTTTDSGIVANNQTQTDANADGLAVTNNKNQNASALTKDQSQAKGNTSDLGTLNQNNSSPDKTNVDTSQKDVSDASASTTSANSNLNISNNLTQALTGSVQSYTPEISLTRLNATATIQTVVQPNQVNNNDQLQKQDQQSTDQSKVDSNTSNESVQFEVRTLDQQNKVPNIGLFRTTPDSKAGYLIETDPEYTQYKNWLSSDYMLSALGLDPSLQQKRLGDGFYEQKMVQDQIAQLTGRRFIDGYASNDEQYKALMNNGVTLANTYGLRPGVALTAEQMSQLTSDIVWLVEKTVTLPDGTVTKALVPQVYIRAQVGDLLGDGTLISANQIEFKTKEAINNTGTIAGRELVSLKGSDIDNSGQIRGATIGLVAEQDINNIGGTIKADNKLVMDAGRDINNNSSLRSELIKTDKTENTSTYIDRVGSIHVGKVGSTATTDDINLIMNAGRDINVKAGAIQNTTQGSSVLQSVGDINIDGIEQTRKVELYQNAQNHALFNQSTHIGSQISTVGNLNLQGNTIAVTGSSIASQKGDVNLIAQNKVDITEGRDSYENENAFAYKSRGFLSKKSTVGNTYSNTNSAQSSIVEGNNVNISANQVKVQGSQVAAENEVNIQAKENVDILVAKNTSEQQHSYVTKKSGITASLSDGVASIGYGSSNINNKGEGQSTTLTQSVISSKTGDTTIIAGKDLTTEAAVLSSGKDLNLQGANVNLNAGYESNDQHSEVHSKNSGISIGVTYSPISAAISAYQKNTNNGDFSNSAVGNVMEQANALDKAYMAAKTPIVLTAGNHKSDQINDSSRSQAIVTQASAQGNLNIIAKDGSINSQGAQLSAEGDALLHAKDDINLTYAKDHQDQSSSSKQSGFSIDTRDWLAPAGTYNNKDKAAGDVDKVTSTQLSVKGKTQLQTEQGDINILGSSVASTGDVNIIAARDINIKSTQNSQNQSQSSSSSGIGSAQISDTEQFYGYMNGKSQSNSNSVEQQRSQVGSLAGNVNIQAGNNYNQQVADVVANKDVNITAKQINVLEDHNTGSSSSSSDDLKIGVFKKVSSPLLDLLGAADKVADNSQANDRTQALQALAAGAQAYQTYNDVTDAQDGTFAKVEVGIGFSTKDNQQKSSYATSQQNNIKAGGNVNLTSTEGDIHLQNTQVKAKDTINLDSAKDILLESGQSQEKADGKNSNASLSVGYGASVGAKNGVYIYGEAGYGQGSNHLDSNTHNQTILQSDKLNIKSKGDTTLAGATATANRIDADVGGKLSIISQQDTVDQKIDQNGVGLHVQGGLGNVWSASGNLNNSNAKGNYNSVNQQSGLFAGDGGYHVKADSVDLKGGAIVSTASKENNDLTANSLTFSNIENKSSYDATTVSLSGGTQLGGAKSDSSDSKASTPTNNQNWRNATSFSPSLPQHESDKSSSTTYATLSDGNITIGGKQTTVEQLGIHSDAATASKKLDTLPNLQNMLDNQKSVADATSTIAAATRTYSQNQQKQAEDAKNEAANEVLEKIKEQGGSKWLTYQSLTTDADKQAFLINNSQAYKAAYDDAQSWGIGGDKSRALNAVTTAITGALGGQTDLQAATNVLAPYASQLIGKTFGEGKDKNTVAQLAAHAILGGVLAYVNGGDQAAGGTAAVASEAAANYLAKQYNDGKTAINPKTGEFDPNLLPEGVKSSIRDMTAAIGAAVGGTVGDSAFNAQIAGVVSKNVIENNALHVVKKDGTKSYDLPPVIQNYNVYEMLVGTGAMSINDVPNAVFEKIAQDVNLNGNKATTAEDYKKEMQAVTQNGKYEIDPQTLLSSIPESAGIRKLYDDVTITQDNVTYKFAKYGLDGLSNSELKNLSDLMLQYSNYRPGLGDQISTDTVELPMNKQITFMLIQAGLAEGNLKTISSTDSDRQSTLNQLYSNYNRLFMTDEQIQYQRDGMSRLVTSSTSALGTALTLTCQSDYHTCTGRGEMGAAFEGAFGSIFVGKAITPLQNAKSEVTIIKNDVNSSTALNNTKNVPVSKAGGTIELFTDINGAKVPGAIGIGPTDPNGIGMDARSMPNIATGSQAKVVANNPYIPDSVGGTRSIMDWLPEAARITQKGGEIIMNASPRNPNLRSLQNLDDNELLKLGLVKTYEGELLPEFKNMNFAETGGKTIPSNKVNSIIFKKVN